MAFFLSCNENILWRIGQINLQLWCDWSVDSWTNKLQRKNQAVMWVAGPTNSAIKMRLLCRAAQINSAVTMRLFVGELAKKLCSYDRTGLWIASHNVQLEWDCSVRSPTNYVDAEISSNHSNHSLDAQSNRMYYRPLDKEYICGKILMSFKHLILLHYFTPVNKLMKIKNDIQMACFHRNSACFQGLFHY